MLSLFDDADEMLTYYQPPSDRLVLIAGQLADAPGLRYIPQFIEPNEERQLLADADCGAWSDFWTRKTQFYGIRYDRTTRTVHGEDPLLPLPSWADWMRHRLVERGILDRLPNQMGINEYLPGQGIAGHVDYFGGSVVSLTLASGCVMDVTQPATKQKVSLWLAPRSILLLTGASRNIWEHGIARRSKDVVDGRPVTRHRRVSLTFRDVQLAGQLPLSDMA